MRMSGLGCCALYSVGTTAGDPLDGSRRLKGDKSKPSVLIALHLVPWHVHIQHVTKLRHVVLLQRLFSAETLWKSTTQSTTQVRREQAVSPSQSSQRDCDIT